MGKELLVKPKNRRFLVRRAEPRRALAKQVWLPHLSSQPGSLPPAWHTLLPSPCLPLPLAGPSFPLAELRESELQLFPLKSIKSTNLIRP